MVSSVGVLVLFLLVSSSCSAVLQNAFLPKAALIPVDKDSSTFQYVSTVFLGHNRAPLKLALDLNAPFVWFQCGSLSSRKSVESCSLKCAMGYAVRSCCFNFRRSDCKSKMCSLTAENCVSGASAATEMNEDELFLRFLNDLSSDSSAKIDQFLFSCAPDSLLKGLPASSKGVLGLGSSRISLPSQFSSAFRFFERKFSICLSPTKGAVFLGGNPFDTETSFTYTPLIPSKESSGFGYYINLQAIKISGKKLSFHEKGAKLSTLFPFATMETSIYHTFLKAYLEAAISLNLSLVSPVAPFDACFSSKVAGNIPNFPVIDLVLQSEMVVWRLLQSNSIVHVSDEVMCLGFVDGGLNQKDPIVLGGLQLENHLLEFNLGSSMLGFSSMEDRKCSDFDAERELYIPLFQLLNINLPASKSPAIRNDEESGSVNLATNSSLLKKVLAETLGSFVLMFCIYGIMANLRFMGIETGLMEYAATAGLTVTVIVFSTGSISGAHLNPAVTFALALVGPFPWRHVPFYVAAQVCGTVLSTFVGKQVYGVEPEMMMTRPLQVSAAAFVVELIATSIVLFLITYLNNELESLGQLSGLITGIAIGVGVLISGPVSGGSMNPARSLGRALVSWRFDHLWIYVFAPVLGAVGGASAYRMLCPEGWFCNSHH